MAFQLSQQRRQSSLPHLPFLRADAKRFHLFVYLFALPTVHCFVLLCFALSCFVFCFVLQCVPVTRMFCACYNCALYYLQYVKVGCPWRATPAGPFNGELCALRKAQAITRKSNWISLWSGHRPHRELICNALWHVGNLRWYFLL